MVTFIVADQFPVSPDLSSLFLDVLLSLKLIHDTLIHVNQWSIFPISSQSCPTSCTFSSGDTGFRG